MHLRNVANAGDMRAAPFILRKARAFDRDLAQAIRRVATKADEEALHDMRVAMRRLRTLLRLSRPLYGRFRTDTVRAAFSEVQSRTGELRDEEVLEVFEQAAIVRRDHQTARKRTEPASEP